MSDRYYTLINDNDTMMSTHAHQMCATHTPYTRLRTYQRREDAVVPVPALVRQEVEENDRAQGVAHHRHPPAVVLWALVVWAESVSHVHVHVALSGPPTPTHTHTYTKIIPKKNHLPEARVRLLEAGVGLVHPLPDDGEDALPVARVHVQEHVHH